MWDSYKSHNISVRTSSIVKSTLSWWPLITEINLIGTNLIIVLWLGPLFLSTNMSRNLYFSCFLVDGSIQYFDFKFVVEDVNLLIFIWPKLISFCPIHGTGVGKADENNFIILNCQWKCAQMVCTQITVKKFTSDLNLHWMVGVDILKTLFLRIWLVKQKIVIHLCNHDRHFSHWNQIWNISPYEILWKTKVIPIQY